MKTNKLLILIFALLFSLPLFANIKIGVVDVQKAIQGSERGKNAKSQLEKAFNKKKKKLDKMDADLKKLKEDLEKKSLVMSDDVKKKRSEEFQRKIIAFQQERAKSEQEIRVEEQKLTQPILNDIKKIIDQLAKKEKYSVIFQKAEHNVLFATNSIDLTNQVIKELGKKKK